MKIDAHQHFWRYDPAEYEWIDDSMTRLRRDFLPDDLQREIAAVGVDGVVAVQARQSLEETRWLLALAAEHDFIRGVVGWAPLAAPDVRDVLAELAVHPRLKGVRHVVQGEPDDFLLRDDFNAGVGALVDFGLVYDILIYERQLPQTIQFVDRHPRQVFVLDHLAKPRAKEEAVEPWRGNIGRLAERPNVYCKVSGLATEADWHGWTADGLRVYFDTVLAAFGPRRLMFGSDWPVCLLATAYHSWYELVERWCETLTPAERARMFGETAREVYNL